ncbi:MAG TPA: F0F1 ATP synthase subunit A [Tepidiformaceae bacterium]|nr:F0F1 ATP synthase subunit A [Tepidiformaceae bacterium]
MKPLYMVIGGVAVLGWLAVGLIVARGPQPEIIVAAEIITKVGPVNISNTMITAWMTMAFLIVLSLIATRSMSLLPSGLQNFVEATVDFLLGQVEEIAGQEHARRFFMVIATFFLFIIVSNWMGLLPFFSAIGKTEDVGYEVFHEIALHEEEGHAFEEEEHFAAWKTDKTAGIGLVKPGGDSFEFTINPGTEPVDALGAYIVALAKEYTDFEPAHEVEGEHGGPADPEDIVAAAAALEAEPNAPKLLLAEAGEDHGDEEAAHGVAVPALESQVTGIDFPGQKLALIIPYFRGTFSDVNNTLALGICSFLVVEFWGFQVLGFGYLRKFFQFGGNPINTFVGLLELLSEIIRIISFTFRLFGNVFAGEVLILMLTFLMPFLFVDIIYGLELFVGFIQAAVFSLLTLVFATMAIEGHGDHGDGDHAEGHAGHEPGAVQAHH